MARMNRGYNRTPYVAIGLALLTWSISGFDMALAGDADVLETRATCNDSRCRNGCIGHRGTDRIPAAGPLGYGRPGIHPGFQGFGKNYHLGYGYGGDALGTPSGGYPFYGGPGYPHPWPKLRRIGGINPFTHYAGPGFPTPDHPNFYGATGPLVVDPPVITTTGGPSGADVANSYGSFTGAISYPDSAFAPFTSDANESQPARNTSAPSPTSRPEN